MIDTKLIEKVRVYCKCIIEESRCKNLPFHNWKHTMDVVQVSESIAHKEKLPREGIEELIIAAYFHDIGNIQGPIEHEDLSCKYAQSFLEKEEYPSYRIENVLNIINATKLPQNPKTHPQKIICDADLAHLGKKNFTLRNIKLRQEWSIFNDQKYTDEQWIDMNIDFLESHCYHTSYAQKYFSVQKNENINALKAKAHQL